MHSGELVIIDQRPTDPPTGPVMASCPDSPTGEHDLEDFGEGLLRCRYCKIAW